MKQTEPVDYLAATEQHRQAQQTENNQIYDPDFGTAPEDTAVDYLAISKAWEQQLAGKDRIHMKAGKRNPSHDPVR